MNINRTYLLVALVQIAFWGSTTFAFDPGLSGVSPECLHECETALGTVGENKSAEPLLALLRKYPTNLEQAHLEVNTGIVYGQRTGVVDPEKAVEHFTAALRYELPERTYIQVLMWRGNSQEQLKKQKESLRDYLRGLLACSYYDLSGGWPEIKIPTNPMLMNSPDPENTTRVRDYNMYRKRLDFQQFLFTQRFFFIDAVKRVTSGSSVGQAEILDALNDLSPDSTRTKIVIEWLNSENKRPWP